MFATTEVSLAIWASYQIRKIEGCGCAENAGNIFPPPRVSDPDMHHGTCVTHVSWCMPGSLTSDFLWSGWRQKHSQHSRRTNNTQFYVSGKRPIGDFGSHFDGSVHCQRTGDTAVLHQTIDLLTISLKQKCHFDENFAIDCRESCQMTSVDAAKDDDFIKITVLHFSADVGHNKWRVSRNVVAIRMLQACRTCHLRSGYLVTFWYFLSAIRIDTFVNSV